MMKCLRQLFLAVALLFVAATPTFTFAPPALAASPTIIMLAPAANASFSVPSGNTYVSDTNRLIPNPASGDVAALQNQGCILLTPRNNVSAISNPTNANDYTQAYGVGSIWVNVATPALYVLTAMGTTLGTATWTNIASPVSGLSPYYLSNIFLSKTTNYTVNTTLNADDHKVILLNSGSTGNQTLIFAPLSSWADPNATFGFCNTGTRAWIIDDTLTSEYFLYPGQCNMMYPTAGNFISWNQHPMPYAPGSAVTLYVGPSGSCNDANDGLAATSDGQMCTVSAALARLRTFNNNGSNPSIQLADGTYTEAVTWSGQRGNIGDGVNVVGDMTTPTNVVFRGSSSPAFSTRDFGLLFVTSMEIACPVAGDVGVTASQFATIDVTDVTFGSCDSDAMNLAGDGGHIDWDGGNIIAGNASDAFLSQGVGAQFEVESQTITCTGNYAITYWVESTDLSEANMPGLTFSGCSGVTGTRYLGASNAVIQTGGGGSTYFPGNVNGSVSGGAIYE